ncbi:MULTISPECIES: serine hydrolase domain-containing protein [unclassified Rathayibacter]|uniref:serine hydrolase domain-containing protein n=1 Tax=unclassified Rathayibacter TaxID=2609250 RepID=UPI00188A8818|nr:MULTISPECIES: serine hydrolase [unclassified Rathayibacter]MBF4463049.1 serine hydrolase [Rathayibacter sp. VKM Ac-2879]MBF4504714.1 serine hydrolase [Rathayibacter sp. VKM Ac-2878]
MSASSVLAHLVARIDAEGLAAHGVHVAVGEEETEHRWRGEERANVYSASKGVCALAVGIAIDEGVLAAESTVAELLPALRLGTGVGEVTVVDLLAMRSGIDFAWFADQPVGGPDLAQEMLGRDSVGRGDVFHYSDASTYAAMRMLGAVVGDVAHWLEPRLFAPLGIEDLRWQRCPAGWIVGGSGLELRTGGLARIGRLLRDRGLWRGQRLVDGRWIDRMSEPWRETGAPAPFEHYGLALWKGPGSCRRLDGLYGQYVLIAGDAVVTITAHEEERDHLLAELAAEALGGR